MFAAFSSRYLNFAVQFYFRCKFSFHEERDSSRVWQWRNFSRTNHNSFLPTGTNKIASFCIDNRSCQMAFFRLRQIGQLRQGKEIFWNKKGFSLSHKTNRLHAAVRLFNNRSQMTSKCGKNISDTLGHLFVLTTFRRHLWSLTEQTHDNVESIG